MIKKITPSYLKKRLTEKKGKENEVRFKEMLTRYIEPHIIIYKHAMHVLNF